MDQPFGEVPNGLCNFACSQPPLSPPQINLKVCCHVFPQRNSIVEQFPPSLPSKLQILLVLWVLASQKKEAPNSCKNSKSNRDSNNHNIVDRHLFLLVGLEELCKATWAAPVRVKLVGGSSGTLEILAFILVRQFLGGILQRVKLR